MHCVLPVIIYKLRKASPTAVSYAEGVLAYR